jgi:hypothetical protein
MGMKLIKRRLLTFSALLLCSGLALHATPPGQAKKKGGPPVVSPPPPPPSTPVVPVWPNDFTYLGKTVLQSAPYPNDSAGRPVGDFRFGKGLAVHAEADGSVSIFTGSWNPQPMLRWRTTPVNGAFSGSAAFVRSLGTSVYLHGELIGLYLDDDGDLISSFNSTYDGDPTIDWTMGRAYLDPVTGAAISRGTFKFANRSDKMTQGGVTSVPDWWRTKYNQNCNGLVGWGGYWSVIATGPASMGPAAACITLPRDTDMPVGGGGNPTPLPNIPVLGFPFSSSLTVQTPATQRTDIDYYQTYGWGWWPAKVTSGLGNWNPGDWLYQGCTWADTGAVSGLVCVPLLQEGCNWYGSNLTPPVAPVCNPGVPGQPATLNSQRQRPWVFIYDPADLGAVVTGARSQTSVQPVSQTPLTLPGVTTPFPGLPDMNHLITGVTFEPTKGWLAIMVRDTSTATGRPSIYWYKVRS